MYLVSALGCAFCWNLESFYVFRFIGGLAIGASSVLAPVYISEIAPAGRRGALTGLVPVQHRVRHPARLREQFSRAGALGWRGSLAPEARHRGGAGAAVHRADVHDSAESAVARIAWPDRGGESGLQRVGVDGDATRCWRNSTARRSRAAQFGAAAVYRGLPPADRARDSAGHVQPALGHQRHPLLLQRHLRVRRIQRMVERVASRGHRRGKPDRDHDRPASHRSRRAKEAAAHRSDRHGVCACGRGGDLRDRAGQGMLLRCSSCSSLFSRFRRAR